MSEINWIALGLVALVTVATVVLGIWATRKSKTVGDFFVAGRSVSVFWNASAISGEYLSAASFMGVAGLIMKNGYDAMWYPIGYAAGYLFLLLFIAGPLRRFGAYTIPDFAEGRFDSAAFRKIAVVFVLFIGFFYTMPQMKGAGVTMASILNWPYWAGIAIVGSVITFNVAVGGMKGITLVQAFQYWVKAFAISLPLFVIMSVYDGYPTQLDRTAAAPAGAPYLTGGKEVKFKGKDAAPANAISFSTVNSTWIVFPEGAEISKISLSRKPLPGEDPIDVKSMVLTDEALAHPPQVRQGRSVSSDMPAFKADTDLEVPPNAGIIIRPAIVRVGGKPVVVKGAPVKTSVKVEFAKSTKGVLALPTIASNDPAFRGAPPAPNAPNNKSWISPFGPLTSKYGYPLLYTYSLIIALVCGTAGLPHILVRFYTNPDGRAAKRTTLWVMVLLGAFYVFTPMWGAMARAIVPELYANNTTDSAVIKLPLALENHLLGQILSGVTSAGAFAAFMSTFSGLLVSMSGAFAHDIYGKILKPQSSPESRLRAFKVAAVVVGVLSMLLGLLVENFDIATMVGWAFAIGAASYFPLLLLGSWWKGLTKTGAAAGMLTGGLLSLLAIVCSMLLDKKVLTWELSPLVRSLMEQPAIWGVPLSILTMVFVSKATASTIPADVQIKMLRLHAPEELGFSKNYIQ